MNTVSRKTDVKDSASEGSEGTEGVVEKANIILENIEITINRLLAARMHKVLLVRAQKEMRTMLLETGGNIIVRCHTMAEILVLKAKQRVEDGAGCLLAACSKVERKQID